MCKKLLCKYQNEKDWREYIVDYTEGVDSDNHLSCGDWINYLIPVLPYNEGDITFYRCSCYCSTRDEAYPIVKYDGHTYCMWKRSEAEAFINKFNQDAVLLKEMSRTEKAINQLE